MLEVWETDTAMQGGGGGMTTEEFMKQDKEECKTMCYVRHLAERIESIAAELSIYEDDRVYAHSMQKEIKRLAKEIILELGEAAE